MKPATTRKWIGGVATLFGLCWSLYAILPVINWIGSDKKEILDLSFLLSFSSLFAVPGILAAVFGVRLFLNMSESSLKWVIGVLSGSIAFLLSALMAEASLLPLPEHLQFSALLFVASLIAIFSYLLVVRNLLHHLCGKDRRWRSLLNRGVLLLIAFQVWLLLTGLFREYSPIKEGYDHVPEGPWLMLGLVVPIATAFVLYRVFGRMLPKTQQDDIPNT